MLPALDVLRRALAQVLVDKEEQGHDTSGLDEELASLPDSYDALVRYDIQQLVNAMKGGG